MKSILSHTFLILGCAAAFTAHGQSLVVNLLSEVTEEYPVSEIRSIKFTASTMVLYQNDGTMVSWNIADIFNYEFDLTLSARDGALDASNALKIYPNPSSDRVQIEYTGSEPGDVMIEVLDGSGRLLDVLYRGRHAEKTKAEWDVRSAGAAPGTYLCRVIGSNSKVVTGKIIVQ